MSIEKITNGVTTGAQARKSINTLIDSIGLSLNFNGLELEVGSFATYEYTYSGGTLTILPNGVWYVGVDLVSGDIIALPRLGHRGWIPVARVKSGPTTITEVEPITPELPTSRLPRFNELVLKGQPLNVLVLGSSLAAGTSSTNWAGMLFGYNSSITDYKVPGDIDLKNWALGGAPNQYTLAQVGFASDSTSINYEDAGYVRAISGKKAPNGRSSAFSDIDLVVLTVLANGGDYRLECIEPIVRNLRKLGIEVLLTTDNPQGYPFADFIDITDSALYNDGRRVLDIADRYKCEFADTAAYVAEATLRYPSVAIYSDSIHMAGATPVGRTGQPGSGHEVWARAIRSCINVDGTQYGTVVGELSDFNSGGVEGWYDYSGGIISNESGRLRVMSDGTTGWGVQVDLHVPLNAGDDVTINLELYGVGGINTNSVTVGLQGGGSGWGSNVIGASSTPGVNEITVTASRDGTDRLLIFCQETDTNLGFEIDNAQITINSTFASEGFEIIPCRKKEDQILPPSRLVKDTKAPGDAFIILPSDERIRALSRPEAGTLEAHPSGANSFARRFSSEIGTTEDLLTVESGQHVSISAFGVVGFSAIHYLESGAPEVNIDVYINGVLKKSLTIPSVDYSREMYFPIYTPTQLDISSPSPNNRTVNLRVTSGTLKVAALIALTSEIEYLTPEDVSYVGTWTDKVTITSPGMPGYGSDTADDYAVIKCPRDANRLSWIISSKPNSQPINTWSGRTLTSNQSTSGANHLRLFGHHVGPGEFHYIQLTSDQSNMDQLSNGYGLHIGGAILVYDR